MKTDKFFYFIAVLLWVSIQGCFSQSSVRGNDILQALKNSGDFYSGFNIRLDERIEENYYKHLIFNERNSAIMGYRIRIFSGSGHDAFQKANETRARFLSKYEDISAYITYVAPDYKVYVGDCRTRSEVLKLFSEINKDFPYAFLVAQPINVGKDN